MNRNNRSRKILWGMFFLIAAVWVIVSQLNFWPFFIHISTWNIVLTVLFAWMIMDGITQKSVFEMIFGAAFLAILYGDIFNVTIISSESIFCAAVLAFIGLKIIFPNKRRNRYRYNEYSDNGKKYFDNADGSVLKFENNFGSTTKYINTDNLERASLENNFGEMKVYFDNAIIANGVAEINVEVGFGQMTLFIPKTWKIENHTSCTCGKVNENGMNEGAGPLLKIYGDISFGSLVIMYI